MHTWLQLSVGLAMGLMLWVGTALGQARPACDQKAKTPERVQGEITKIDAAQGRVTVRESDGTVHEFQASTETLQDLKVGGRVEAKLREAPKC
jgi:aconitase B